MIEGPGYPSWRPSDEMTAGTFSSESPSRPFSDPVTVEVIRYGLDAAAEQMARSIERSARSQVIREMLDYSTAISKLVDQNVTLAQRLAILEEKLKERNRGGS